MCEPQLIKINIHNCYILGLPINRLYQEGVNRGQYSPVVNKKNHEEDTMAPWLQKVDQRHNFPQKSRQRHNFPQKGRERQNFFRKKVESGRTFSAKNRQRHNFPQKVDKSAEDVVYKKKA